MTTKTATKSKVVPLLVTTENKGVFFGYGEETDGKIIRLTDARMCVYWTAEVRGALGLASVGPNKSCRIGFKVPAITLQGVVSVTLCTKEAAEAFEKNFWS
jgi:hypothetical protein